MTFRTIRLPLLNFKRLVTVSPQTPHTGERLEDKSDMCREYIERLITADACVGEFGVQALMGIYPKDF